MCSPSSPGPVEIMFSLVFLSSLPKESEVWEKAEFLKTMTTGEREYCAT